METGGILTGMLGFRTLNSVKMQAKNVHTFPQVQGLNNDKKFPFILYKAPENILLTKYLF